MKCYKCNSAEVLEEYQRCSACEAEHKALAKKLDSQPRTKKNKKVKEKLYVINEIKQGIKVKVYLSEEDARANGMDITKLIPA